MNNNETQTGMRRLAPWLGLAGLTALVVATTSMEEQALDWGPNAKFGYPLHGGTLGLWKGVLPFLGDRVR